MNTVKPTLSTVQHASAQTFQQDVLQSPVPVLVDFYADWCGPCRRLTPTLERLAGEFSDRARIVKVNIDQEQELASQFRVESIPTLILMLNGQVVGRATGLVAEPDLRHALQHLTDQPSAR